MNFVEDFCPFCSKKLTVDVDRLNFSCQSLGEVYHSYIFYKAHLIRQNAVETFYFTEENYKETSINITNVSDRISTLTIKEGSSSKDFKSNTPYPLFTSVEQVHNYLLIG